MNLYLLRHGLAVEPGSADYTRDADRPLTPKGERKLWRVAEAMNALGLSFDRIVSSPYVRARQTAELVAQAVGLRKRLEFTDALLPGASPTSVVAWLKRLEPAPDDVLLVGHEPGLSALVSLLVAGDASLALDLKKGGLCKLSAESLAARRPAVLEWLLTPKQMQLMA